LRFSLKFLKKSRGRGKFCLGPPFEIFSEKFFPEGATPYLHPCLGEP